MHPFEAQLNWIASQRLSMIELLETWANINSFSDNLAGLASMLSSVKSGFAALGGEMKEIPLPPRIRIDSLGNKVEIPSANALLITKHPNAPIKVFLGGHMDTVYSPASSFQKVKFIDKQTMQGPGVADMKGGLIVMLKALEALELSSYAGKVGWEVLINPDEEIGSPGSEPLFTQAAQRNHIGLIYEPTYADGSIVSSRKGSANFTVVIKGRSAHAGRDFFAGRNALSAMARFIVSAEELIDEKKGVTLNIGQIEGGGPANIVPELAVGRFNLRMADPTDLPIAMKILHTHIASSNKKDGITAVLHEIVARAPKPFDKKNEALFNLIKDCGSILKLDLKTKPSGGVCDGNILSAAGLPTIDTLGVVGGNIHTPEEYMLIDSLTERASLSALLLLRIASGEVDITRLKTGLKK